MYLPLVGANICISSTEIVFVVAATIQVKKEIGEIPEDFEAETAETAEEAEVSEEEAGTTEETKSTEETDTSSATE